MTSSPFHRFNLWRNPFGELDRVERAALAVVQCDTWLDFLDGRRAALQFIGPCGHGKSTHLLALQARLVDSVYIYLPLDEPNPPIGIQRPLILDEAQRLRRFTMRRLARADGPIVFGTHVDVLNTFQKAGWKTQSIDLTHPIGFDRLMDILNRRIESSRLQAGPVPRIEKPTAVRLLQLWGNDVRAMEHFLYDEFQKFIRGEAVWPPAI